MSLSRWPVKKKDIDHDLHVQYESFVQPENTDPDVQDSMKRLGIKSNNLLAHGAHC